MKMSSLMVGFMLLAFLLTGMTNFYLDLFSTYDTPDTENITADISDERDAMKTDLQDTGEGLSDTPGGEETGIDNAFQFVTLGAWNGFVTVLTFPGQLLGAATTLLGTGAGGQSMFSMPDWVLNLISAIVWIIFLFTGFAIAFKVKI